MRLLPHPATPCAALDAIEATARRDGAGLVVDFVATGRLDKIRRAPASSPARTDGLWKTTCFECFVRAPGAADYLEFNFAPSTQWAAYAFARYREPLPPPDVAPPRVVVRTTPERLTLGAALMAPLPEGPLIVALTAVVEDADGALSYWSLRHGPGKPDFHAADGFLFQI